MRAKPVAAEDLPSPLDLPAQESADGCLEQPMSPEQARYILTQGAPNSSSESLDWANYSAALYVNCRDEEALTAARFAVKLGRNTTTLRNLGVVLEAHGAFADAAIAFEEAHRRDPRVVFSGAAYSDALIRLGRWREGWPLYAVYHARLNPAEMYVPTLKEVAGRRVLVLANGGAGDSFYHLRWLRLLRDAGCHITLAGPAALLSALDPHPWIDAYRPAPKRSFEIVWSTVSLHYADAMPNACVLNLNDFDAYLSSLSLPAVVGALPSSAIWPGPYVASSGARVKRRGWRGLKLFPQRRPRQRIGVCWKAGEGRFPRPHRTLSFEQRDTLLRSRPLNEWVNLTSGEEPVYGIEYPSLASWRETAEIIAGLDLVVTVDTGVSHLAGAMGKPVWVILPTASAWPYGLGGGTYSHEMAYPTMRVFRNDGLGIDDALGSCCHALERL